MTRRPLVLLGLAIAGVLAIAVQPGAQGSTDARAGGIFKVTYLTSSGDLRPRRPGAGLLARELGAPGHGLRAADALPRQTAAARLPARARRRGGTADRLGRRQDLDVQAPERLPLQQRQPRARRRVRAGDLPHDGTGGRLARLRLHARDRRRRGRPRRSGPDRRPGSSRAGNTLVVRFTRPVRRVRRLDDDAVLLRRPAHAAAERRRGPSTSRAQGRTTSRSTASTGRSRSGATATTAATASTTSTASTSTSGPSSPDEMISRVVTGAADWTYTLSGVALSSPTV